MLPQSIIRFASQRGAPAALPPRVTHFATTHDCNSVSRYISGTLTSRGEAPKNVDEQNKREMNRERERERERETERQRQREGEREG